MAELEQLKELWKDGHLSAVEFARAASEARAQMAVPPLAGAEGGMQQPAEEELLVEEDGDMYAQSEAAQSSPQEPASPAHSPAGSLVGSNGSSPLPSLSGTPTPSATPVASTTRPADEPAVWDSGITVRSTELNCDVTFLRMGCAADFYNAGRAKITYSRIKPGKVRAREIKTSWVAPDTLERIPDESGAEVAPSPQRKSPRGAEHQARSVSDLPELAAHERERKLPKKAEGTRGPQKMETQTKESTVPVEQRIQEFPGHSLCKDPMTGKLRCDACRINIKNIKNTISTHCSMGTPEKPSQHAVKLQIWRTRASDDCKVKTDLVEYFKAHSDELVGTKDEDALLYRFRVSESFVKTPPFSHIDNHRSLLQRAGHSLPAADNLRRFIPKVQSSELALLTSELESQYLGISFDGTTRLGEAVNATGRWCSSDFYINMRLIDFTTVKKHMNNIQLAAHLVEVSRQRGIPAPRIVNIARDSVAVNGAACRRLLITFTSAVDTLCFCHTLCHVGERFELPTLKEFKTPWLELAGAHGRDPHRGAQALWKERVQVAVPGYSAVRWYAWAEIVFVIAEAGMRLLGDFISTCEEREYGDATTTKLRTIYNETPDALRLELAAMLDMRILVSTTYELEGDRLELLLTYDRVEALRALGRSIKAGEDGVLPNVDAVLRRLMQLKKGVKVEKHFNGHGICGGKLEKKEKVDSTLYPGQEREAWRVKYTDGHEEHFEEEELRSGKPGGVPAGQDGKPVLLVRDLPERKAICDGLAPGFDYLEARVMGTCDAQYSLVAMYELCKLVRVFDPNFAAAHANPAFVDCMSVITPLNALDLLRDLKQELPLYLAAAANAPGFDKASVADYSKAVLSWWRANGGCFKAWALAARIVFAISPNSASCERVFALLKRLFGEQQMSSLADLVQTALMLNYNDRSVG